jgi:hypothetical protein
VREKSAAEHFSRHLPICVENFPIVKQEIDFLAGQGPEPVNRIFHQVLNGLALDKILSFYVTLARKINLRQSLKIE